MRCRLLAIILIFAAMVPTAPGIAQHQEMGKSQMADIPASMIDDMFIDMRRNLGRKVDEPLLWGYFFIGDDASTLERAATLLVSDGYTFVDIFADEDEQGLWWLHVERVEHHTPESLMARNAKLNAFAQANDLLEYDGMDVGPAP